MRTTSPGQSALLLLDVIDILNERRILYAIIGAFAASFYGMVRASLDADAVISIDHAQQSLQLCDDFRLKGLLVEDRKGDHNDPIREVINVQDRFGNRVDLLIGIRGMAQEVFSRTQKTKFSGSSINIVSLEDLIALKIFAGSPKDLQDVIGVVNVSGKKINLGSLQAITARYGADCVERLQILLKENPLEK